MQHGKFKPGAMYNTKSFPAEYVQNFSKIISLIYSSEIF